MVHESRPVSVFFMLCLRLWHIILANECINGELSLKIFLEVSQSKLKTLSVLDVWVGWGLGCEHRVRK